MHWVEDIRAWLDYRMLYNGSQMLIDEALFAQLK